MFSKAEVEKLVANASAMNEKEILVSILIILTVMDDRLKGLERQFVDAPLGGCCG